MHERMRATWEVVFFEDIDLGNFERAGEVTAITPPFFGRVDAAFLDHFPNLKIVSNFGVGYDNIDAAEAARRGIVVAHTPEVLNDETANTAILLFLAVHRAAVAQDAYLRAGRWAREGNAPLTRGIAGQKVGILGMGRIGQAIAQKLGVFGVEVMYHARHPHGVGWRYCPDLVAMAREADTLIVVVPGGAATEKLVGAEVIEALGPTGVLINIARGSVVDEEALVAALVDGRLGGAGLDVYAHEPEVPPALIALDNVVLLPHVGSATVETRRAMGDLVCDNLDDWLRTGRARHPVPECADL